MTRKKTKRRLRKYQVDALRWSDSVSHPGFFIDMRMGKCLLMIRRVQRWGVTGNILVVAPYPSFDGWQKDLRLDGLPPAVELMGSKKQRLEKLHWKELGEQHWFLINKEGHRSLPEIRHFDWEVVIIDESRYIANPLSAMSKFYVNQFRDVRHRVILTGTPDYKEKLDYYQQLRFLDYNILPYKNYWHFRTEAFNHFGYSFSIKKKHRDILASALKKNTYLLKRSDCDIGRKKVHEVRMLQLPRDVRKVYRQVEDEFILETKKNFSSTLFSTVSHIWLMRLCGGFIDNKLTWKGKYNELLNLLKYELDREFVVILFRFKEEIRGVSKKLKEDGFKSVIEYHGDIKRETRRQILRDFNSGKHAIILGQPNSFSHGTDLSRATCLIYYSQPNGKEIRDQSEDRLVTMSDEKTVLVIDLIVKDTVDEDARNQHQDNLTARQAFEKRVKKAA